MQRNFKFKSSLMMAALTAAMMASCSKGETQTQEKEEEDPLVKIEKVNEENVMQKGVYTASVDADLINNISSSTPNRIKEIFVDDGMTVTKGQRLVVLDDVNIVNYEQQVKNAQANLNTAEATLKNAQDNYDRTLNLFNIGGGTKQNVDAMETQVISAKNQVAAARNSLAAAERTLRNSKENTVLTAPISGVVTARNYDPGDMTGALPILTIAKVQPLKVVCNISETEYSKVKKGMIVGCTFDTYGDQQFEGTITMISPTINTQTRTFGIEVTLPNPDNKVLPGMFGRVTINFGEERHVVVPDQAVVKQPGSGNQYVYVYKDGKVSYNKVELGQRIGNSYEILSGVNAGDEVVVSGQSKLADGIKVRVAK